MPKVTSAVLSPFAINRCMALQGADAEEFRPEQWAGEEDGAAAIESNYRFLTFLAGLRGCIRNMFAKVEFKSLLAATISKFGFEQDKKREVAIKARLKVKPQRGIPVSTRKVAWR